MMARKKLKLLAVLVLVLCGMLASFGCEKTATTQEEEKIAEEVDDEEEVEDAGSEEVEPSFQYFYDKPLVLETTTPLGYKLRVTVKYGPWMRTNDTELIESAWKQARLLEEDRGVPIFDDQFYPASHSVTMFTQVMVENLTEGFSFDENNPESFYIQINEANMKHRLMMIADYSDCRDTRNGYDGRPCWLTPNMTRDVWGPLCVSITTSEPDFFTPLKGEEVIPEITISFSTFKEGGGLKMETFSVPLYMPEDF